MSERSGTLTSELVFERLEALRELLRLTDYLSGFRRMAPAIELERARVDGEDVVVLYRPTGPRELALVEAMQFRRWPPRLEEQPIFYPVTNERYASEIAEAWNVPEDGVAFVTRFHLRAEHALRYEVQTVGAAHHAELWVPSDELDALNDMIVGPIEVIARFERAPDETRHRST